MAAAFTFPTRFAALLFMAVAGLADAQILEAIAEDDSAGLAALIAAGADVNAGAGDGGRTLPLVYAAGIERPGMVAQLIAAGADIDAAQPNGRTALMAVAGSGSVEILNMLLANGARPGPEHAAEARAQGQPAMVAILEHAAAAAAAAAYDPGNLGFDPEPSGTLVAAMQVRLILMGYYRGEIDGQLGEETIAALGRFNDNAGAVPADRITAATIAALEPAIHPDCGGGPQTLRTNVYWTYLELLYHGCIAADAELNRFAAITDSRGGGVDPFRIVCDDRGQLVVTADTLLWLPVWSSYAGEFRLANLRIHGGATIGDRGYIIGASSTVSFDPLDP